MRSSALVAVSIVAAACGPRRGGGVGDPSRPHGTSGAGDGPTFALLEGDDVTAPVAVLGESPTPFRYRLVAERSGVHTALRAVEVHGRRVYAAGDGGVVLVRTADGAWQRETTPTTRTLRGLVVLRDDMGEETEVVAVGDGGTVIRRGRGGGWIAEPVPTERDLYDATVIDKRLFVVGDHGTLLEHRGGAWLAIETRTDADLRDFDGEVAVGRGGVVIDCGFWDREQRELARALACVPRPSPTQVDLFATTDAMSAHWSAYGAAGTRLRQVSRTPIEVALDAPLPGGPTIAGVTVNHWSSSVGSLPTILVGHAGVVVFVQPDQVAVSTTITGAPDLHAVSSEALDAFAVGAGGIIVHLQTVDLTIPTVILL